MTLIKNWKDMWQSYAVWLPTIATFLVLNTDYAVTANLVPAEYVPIVVLVSGFIGRIIKQSELNTKG